MLKHGGQQDLEFERLLAFYGVAVIAFCHRKCWCCVLCVMQAFEHGVKNAGAAFCVSCRHLSTVTKMLVLRSVCHAGI